MEPFRFLSNRSYLCLHRDRQRNFGELRCTSDPPQIFPHPEDLQVFQSNQEPESHVQHLHRHSACRWKYWRSSRPPDLCLCRPRCEPVCRSEAGGPARQCADIPRFRIGLPDPDQDRHGGRLGRNNEHNEPAGVCTQPVLREPKLPGLHTQPINRRLRLL